ncbi:MAG: DUF4296 domain-containing protein [Bacteroidota bacterium]
MKNTIHLICFLALLACGEKVIKEPENLIAKEKMTAILYDIAVVQAAVATNKSIVEKYDIEVMAFIFDRYGIDSVQFAESDLYYASIPLEYEAIYAEIERRFEHEKTTLEEARKQKNDSIRNQTKKRADSVKMAKKVKKVQDSLP